MLLLQRHDNKALDNPAAALCQHFSNDWIGTPITVGKYSAATS